MDALSPNLPMAAEWPLTLMGAGEDEAADRVGPWLLQSDDHLEPEWRVRSDGGWPEEGWLVFDVSYDGPRCGIVRLHFNAGRADGREGLAGCTLLPGARSRVSFPLAFLRGQKLKLERRAGSLRRGYNGPPIRLEELREVRLSLKSAAAPQRLQLWRAWLTRHEPEYPGPTEVLVDELGQWTQREWAGKTGDVAMLRHRLQHEHAAAVAASVGFPANRSRFGGWKNVRLAATGRFRAERTATRWWLVDPDGYAFYSVGMDGVSPGIACPVIPGEADCFAEPPGAGDAGINFPERNLARAFGEAWKERWIELTRARLMKWGFNTIANWSDPEIIRHSELPYVRQWPRYPGTTIRLFRDFPDVFDPAFEADAAVCAQTLEPTRDDERLLGYFMMNEPKWAFGDFNLAALMLEHEPGTHTRRALAAWVCERYAGDAARWTDAWGLPGYTAFSQLVDDHWLAAAVEAAGAQEDLWMFSRLMVRRWVEVPVQAARQVDPDQLNLGVRYAYLPNDLPLEGGECFDIFSINAYGMEPPGPVIDRIVAVTGRPVIIGEFHFGALDRGLPSTGLRGVRTQVERGRAYQHYVEQAAAHPAVVGTHWFYLVDQPLLGRGDGENYQIGFVDVCHRPYDELVRHAEATHHRLYPVAAGQTPPVRHHVEEIPNNLYASVSPDAWRAQQ
jgi:hypothetical protein